jgi:macrolide-specific efflux system membrane fusion protein
MENNVTFRSILRALGVGKGQILTTALLVLSAAFTLGAVASATKRYVASGKTAYLTAPVARGDVRSVVMATGTLQAHQQVDVGAQVSGQLRSMNVKLGDHVQKGQLLAEIDPALPQAALRSAQANLQSLQAQRRAVAASLWQADLALQRQQQMLARDATSRQDLEAAKAQNEVLRASCASLDAQISQSRAQVDTAKTNLAYTKITAPMGGEVVAIITQEGQTVVASQQAPVILKIADLETITVKAQVSEADVIRIEPGQAAYFTILGDSEARHAGTLRAIEPAPQDFSNPESKASGPVFYNALFEAPNPEHRMRIGMTAQVTVILDQAKNALYVPLSALGQRTPEGRYPVRVIRSGRDPITILLGIGINDRINVQVLDGLNEGERVIVADEGA